MNENEKELFKNEIKSWLKASKISREEFAEEAGYTLNSLNYMLSKGEVSERAFRALTAAKRKFEKANSHDLSNIRLELTDDTVRKIKDAAAVLGISFEDFIDMVIEKKKSLQQSVEEE